MQEKTYKIQYNLNSVYKWFHGFEVGNHCARAMIIVYEVLFCEMTVSHSTGIDFLCFITVVPNLGGGKELCENWVQIVRDFLCVFSCIYN